MRISARDGKDKPAKIKIPRVASFVFEVGSHFVLQCDVLHYETERLAINMHLLNIVILNFFSSRYRLRSFSIYLT